MSDNELLSEIERQIESIYQKALLCPQMFCRGLSVESYVLALENVLDLLSKEERSDSYRSFLRESNFGMHMFESKFEQRNQCSHTFVPWEDWSDNNKAIADAYLNDFILHWKTFLEWRRRRSRSSSSE